MCQCSPPQEHALSITFIYILILRLIILPPLSQSTQKHMNPAAKKGLTSVILNLETKVDSLLEDNKKWMELKLFSQILQEGLSTILIREKDENLSFRSSLASLLGFGASMEALDEKNVFMKDKTIEEIITIWKSGKNEEYWDKLGSGETLRKTFPKIKLSIDGESLSEVIYVEKPNKYSEISYNVKTLVLTNNIKNVLFCDSIELDFVYVADYENEEFDFYSKVQDYKMKYDLIIFDIKENEKEITGALKKYEAILNNMKDEYCYYVVVSPFAVKYPQASVLNLGKSKAFDEKLQNLCKALAPRQTWEYLNGEVNEKFIKAEKEFGFLFFYETTGCRKDEISNFEMLLKEENWNKLGNKLINMNIFLREIVFKLGKLPKFGA